VPDLNICVFGAVGHNLGDEAIAVASIEELSRRLPHARFALASLRPAEPPPIAGVETFPGGRRNFVGLWRQLKRSTHLIVGGGTLIQDARYLRGPLPAAHLASEMARRIGIPAASMSIGVDRLDGRFSRMLARKLASALDPLIVRDDASAQELNAIGVPLEHVRVAADPAFLLQEQKPTGTVLAELRRPYVAISVLRENLDPLNYRDAIVAACRAAALAGRRLVFVPMDDRPSEDMGEIQAIVRALGAGGDHVVLSPHTSAKQVAWVLRRAEVTVAMRLHAMILSLGLGTQVIGIARALKTSSFLATHTNARTFSARERIKPADLVAELGRVLTESPADRERRALIQMRHVEEDRAAARSGFDLLEQWLDRRAAIEQRGWGMPRA
jgi:polysaccharide pyruvyl transferase WcaK-like protein